MTDETLRDKIAEAIYTHVHSMGEVNGIEDAVDAIIAELEAQNRELHMQVIASDSQAQMAYEEQEQLEAKLVRVVEVLKLIAGRMMK